MSATKPSGIPWLGEVPAHWEVKRLKDIADVRFSNVDKKTEEGEIPVRLCNYTDVYYGHYLDGTPEYMEATATRSEIERFKLRKGDVLITKDSESPTDIAIAAMVVEDVPDLVCGYHLAMIRADRDQIEPAFLYWQLLSDQVREQYYPLANGITRFALGHGEINGGSFVLPPLPEQRAIAAFLDERTARIDALVARKRRLVQLLKEKRQALITRAVTRGLDPKAKMKESGVPWLGEVPEGWEVKPLRNVATFQNGISAGADYFGSGYPFVNYKDVYQWPSLPEQVEGLANSTDIDQERYSVREGDIFFTRTSETNEEIGFASTCLRTMEHATFSGFLIRVRPHRGLLAPNFSKHFFRSDIHRAFFVKEMNLVTRASLGQELLKRLPVLLPPVNEQVAIAEFLDDRLNRLDALVTKVEQAVERLQEYRTALISAAVTGKVPPTRGASADKG